MNVVSVGLAYRERDDESSTRRQSAVWCGVELRQRVTRGAGGAMISCYTDMHSRLKFAPTKRHRNRITRAGDRALSVSPRIFSNVEARTSRTRGTALSRQAIMSKVYTTRTVQARPAKTPAKYRPNHELWAARRTRDTRTNHAMLPTHKTSFGDKQGRWRPPPADLTSTISAR